MSRYGWAAAAVLVAVVAVTGCRTTQHPGAAPSTTSPTPTATSPSASPGPATGASYDPAQFAPQVRTWSAKTGVSARLLLAVLYNEAYKPHAPELERAWQRLKPDSAFGIANMHRAAFDETKQEHFPTRRWEELPDDPALAIQAEAWYLAGLADQLPSHWSSSYTKDELLALGYNTGPGNMLAFARGAHPGTQAQAYLDHLRANLPKADQALAQNG
ncbi:transglycosylase SLT domain-containing protein [Kitasatospora sp. NPDC002227]|uniref:transglycosylase SLT domain-containing protein n=1 Tax=Kitasatospora sp. NPDC002227 TaxID=3154773 RepID=UPI003331EB4A